MENLGILWGLGHRRCCWLASVLLGLLPAPVWCMSFGYTVPVLAFASASSAHLRLHRFLVLLFCICFRVTHHVLHRLLSLKGGGLGLVSEFIIPGVYVVEAPVRYFLPIAGVNSFVFSEL